LKTTGTPRRLEQISNKSYVQYCIRLELNTFDFVLARYTAQLFIVVTVRRSARPISDWLPRCNAALTCGQSKLRHEFSLCHCRRAHQHRLFTTYTPATTTRLHFTFTRPDAAAKASSTNQTRSPTRVWCETVVRLHRRSRYYHRSYCRYYCYRR